MPPAVRKWTRGLRIPGHIWNASAKPPPALLSRSHVICLHASLVTELENTAGIRAPTIYRLCNQL